MLREFRKNVGNFKKGDRRDYPISTWRHMAGNAKMDLDVMTVEVNEHGQTTSKRGASAASVPA